MVWEISVERFHRQYLKVNVQTGAAITWFEEGCYPGEPVFVAPPGSQNEDSGVLLSVVLDVNRERSFLLFLDAADLKEVARAEAPHHIPFGFHGNSIVKILGFRSCRLA